ncbi:hypothetical protein SAMN04488028_104209 [Reichenbachiella agariperforans]|uniref:Uncharacterized protein n=1 Tax=Reichenbachiella agariperforans TaxID=156994 RepID=A0A1M6RKC5_REIAG|nr:hypothetical protein SAMN04488028_104209 [Reichenbachiella agariperforans]
MKNVTAFFMSEVLGLPLLLLDQSVFLGER